MKFRKHTHEDILRTKKSVKEVHSLKRTPIYVVADNIRSLYNVGAIFRTADGVLAEKIYLCGMTAIPPRKEIEKTSLGAQETVPWEYRDTALKAIKELKEKGVKIIALELADNAQHFTEMDFKFPIAIVIGHEINGVSEDVMSECDGAISIPMLGRANSLNVATSFGIAVYQLLDNYQRNHARS